MSKKATISARIDPELKCEAEKVFEALGLNPSQAITLFYRQVELTHGLPFPVRIPNKETRKALDEAENRRNLKQFNSLDDLYKDLDI